MATRKSLHIRVTEAYQRPILTSPRTHRAAREELIRVPHCRELTMSQVVIKNPIINSPFGEPQRQFRFDDTGITNDIIDDRRPGRQRHQILCSRKVTIDQRLMTKP